MNAEYSLSQCMERLFGIQLAKFTVLRIQANTFVRNGLVLSRKEMVNHNLHWFISESQLPTLYNAVLLNGIFDSTKLVKELFDNTGKRREAATWLKELFLGRNSAIGISLLPNEVMAFIDAISDPGFDLRKQQLANPFVNLPQVALSGKRGIMQGLLAQSALLSQGDNMMMAYLNDDLQKAWEYAQHLETDQPVLLQYKALVEKKYQEAIEFEKTLDLFR